MSMYTTGEIAKLCGVSVRTVQYYDTRNILVPSELSEGGRRLYSEADLKRMKIICFLRDAGISINSISELLREKEPGDVISVLIENQETALREELRERKEKLDLLEGIKREVQSVENFSVDSLSGVAYAVKNKKKIKKLHILLLVIGLPLNLIQWVALISGFFFNIWWPLAVWGALAVAYSIWVCKYYFTKVAYICPKCHEVFKPNLKEALWANHTPTLRKVTCPHCGYHGFCIETYGKDGTENE